MRHTYTAGPAGDEVPMKRLSPCRLLMPALMLLAAWPSATLAGPAAHGSLGVSSALPALLETGMALGVGAEVLTAGGLAWGLSTGLGAAGESNQTWRVEHLEWRLRLLGALQHRAGRGLFGLRIGAGFTLVGETRLRHQAARLGLPDEEAEVSALALVPAADLQVAIAVEVLAGWGLSFALGPSLHLPVSGSARIGFNGQLGVARLP